MADQEFPRKTLLTWEVDPDVTRLVMYTYVDGIVTAEEELDPENGSKEVSPRRETTYELVSWCGTTMKDRRQLTVKVLPIPATTPTPTTPLPPIENVRLRLSTNSPINITVDMAGSFQRSFIFKNTSTGEEKNVAVAKGNTIKLTARAKVSESGQTWNLIGWFNENTGVQLSNNNVYEFSILQDTALQARYTQEQIDITTRPPTEPTPPPPPPPTEPPTPPPPVDESDTIRITLKKNRKVYTLGVPFNIPNYNSGDFVLQEQGTPTEMIGGINPDVWSGDTSQLYEATLEGRTYEIPRNSSLQLVGTDEGFSVQSSEYRIHTPLDNAQELGKEYTLYEPDGWYTEDGFLVKSLRRGSDSSVESINGIESGLTSAGQRFVRFSQDITLVLRYKLKPVYRVSVKMADSLREKLVGQNDRKFEFMMPTTFNVNGITEYRAQMPSPRNWVIDSAIVHYSLNEVGINNSGRYINQGNSRHTNRTSIFNSHLIGQGNLGNIDNNNSFVFHVPEHARLQIKWYGMNGLRADEVNIGLRDVDTGMLIGLVGVTEFGFLNGQPLPYVTKNVIDYVDLNDRDKALNDVDYALQGESRGIQRDVNWEIVDLGEYFELWVDVYDQNNTFKSSFRGQKFSGNFTQIQNEYTSRSNMIKVTDRAVARYRAGRSIYNLINNAGGLWQIKRRHPFDGLLGIGGSFSAVSYQGQQHDIHKYFAYSQTINDGTFGTSFTTDFGQSTNSYYQGFKLTNDIMVGNPQTPVSFDGQNVVEGSVSLKSSSPTDIGMTEGFNADVVTFGDQFVLLRFEPIQAGGSGGGETPPTPPSTNPNVSYTYELRPMQGSTNPISLTAGLPVPNAPKYQGIFELVKKGSDGSELVTDIPTNVSIGSSTISGQPSGLNISPTLVNGRIYISYSGTPTQVGQFSATLVVPTTSYGNVSVQGKQASIMFTIMDSSLNPPANTDPLNPSILDPSVPPPQPYNIIPVTTNNDSFVFKRGFNIELSLNNSMYSNLGWDVFKIVDENGVNTLAPSAPTVTKTPNQPADSGISYVVYSTQQRVGFKVTGMPSVAAEHEVLLEARIGDKVAQNRIRIRVEP